YECQINCNSITLTSGFAGDGSVGWVDGAQDLKFPLSLTPGPADPNTLYV
ncbi:Hypothetical protein FKW44_021123, partial [Caligus rogercresseyi]